MILGECPACDKHMMNPMPDRSPAWYRTECEHCNTKIWIYATRWGECLAQVDKPDLEGFSKESL